MDNRTAISRWRLVARASSKLAVLAQAISSSSADHRHQRKQRRAELRAQGG